MREAAIDYLDFRTLPATARLTALLKTRSQAEDLPIKGDLVEALDEAIVEDKKLFALEQRWRQRKRYKVLHGARARDLDRQLDRLLAAVENTLAARVSMKEVSGVQGELAERMHGALFPAGLGGITQVPYDQQAHATDCLLRTLDANDAFQRLAKELCLAGALGAIRRLNAEYTAEVCVEQPLKREELEAARRKGQVRLGRIIALILARFPGDSREDQAGRAELLAPIERQSEAQRALARRRARGGKTASKDRGPSRSKAPSPGAG